MILKNNSYIGVRENCSYILGDEGCCGGDIEGIVV